jgi:DNA polymerase I-like protein with 3'-5' exonuclease and polymerase domains/uracil-DNA glycosylase
MRRLPLYAADQDTPVELAGHLPYDKACGRCSLSVGKKTVCPQPAGTGPGGVLVVVDQLTADEERAGRQGQALIHRLVAAHVHKATAGPFMIDAAVKCYAGADMPDEAIAQCRPYLAHTMAQARPTRIVAAGPKAVEAVLGRTPQLMSTRRGYGWLWSAPWAPGRELLDGRIVAPVPVFLIQHPGMAHANPFLKRFLEADINWACTTPVPQIPPWDAFTEVIETEDDARQAAAEVVCHEAGVALDVETSGRMHSGELRVVSLALALVGTDRSWVWDRVALAASGPFAVLAGLLEDPAVPKTGQSAKFDLQAIIQGMGIEVVNLRGDTRIWRKQIDSDSKADLEHMQELVGMGGGKAEFDVAIASLVKAEQLKAQAVKRLIVKEHPDVGLVLKGQKDQIELLLSQYQDRLTPEQVRSLWRGYLPKAYVYGETQPDLLSRYNATDAVSTGLIAASFEPVLRAEELWHTWESLWGPATEALAQVETWGFMVSLQKIRALSSLFGTQMAMVKQRFAQYPGFDPNSPASVANLLFNQLKLRATKKSEKTGAPSTDHESLEALHGQHPVVDDLLEYRRVAKLKSQYADGMILHVAPDGRIHTTYNVDGARSGRASSQDPNMQNIPSEDKGLDGKLVKDCFVSPPRYVLLASDYKQLEFRIAADLSDDPDMKAVFLSGQDFHQATAELIAPIVWKVQPCQLCAVNHCHVTKAHRRGAKAFNFGIMYGMQDGTIAKNAGCDLATARMIRQAVLGKFKKFAAWIQQCLVYTRKHGVAWTWWLRKKAHRRQLWKILDADDGVRINAENSASNTPVQGTASFYCLASVTALVRWILHERIDAKVVATVHDSIVLEVREDLLPMVARKVLSVMTGWPTITSVPLDVDLKVGTAWGSMVDYAPPEEQAAAALGGPVAAYGVRMNPEAVA